MQDNYSRLVTANLVKLFDAPPRDLALKLPADEIDGSFVFRAFGEECRLSPNGIFVGDTLQNSVLA